MSGVMDKENVLTLDFGNTKLKATLFSDTGKSEQIIIDRNKAADFLISVKDCTDVAVVSHTDAADIPIPFPVYEINSETSVPLNVLYNRDTLGTDRLAAAVGIADTENSYLIADSGTALTLDMINGLNFLGGNISPGYNMRLVSLHKATSRLPIVDSAGPTPVLGYDTSTAIRSGALRGVAYEILATHNLLMETYPALQLVITGGDAWRIIPILEDLDVKFIYNPDAVALGMYKIYRYNNSRDNDINE